MLIINLNRLTYPRSPIVREPISQSVEVRLAQMPLLLSSSHSREPLQVRTVQERPFPERELCRTLYGPVIPGQSSVRNGDAGNPSLL
jgi:hypothetical protein